MNHAKFTVFLILRRLFVLIHSIFFYTSCENGAKEIYIDTACLRSHETSVLLGFSIWSG